MVHSTACPSLDELTAFSSGRLADDDLSRVESHLDNCSACVAILDKKPVDDSLTKVMRKPPVKNGDFHLSPQKIDAVIGRMKNRSAEIPVVLGPGAIIGNYQIVKEIGRGGRGVVFKAKHTTLKRIAALKTILLGGLADSDDVERFLVEAEAAARFEHQGIVPVYEHGKHGMQHYIAMRFIDGQTLAQHLKKLDGRRMNPIEAAKMVRQIARALHYAHTKNVIHRDIKPSNILITSKGVPKIADFGLAKLLDASVQLSMTGDVMGTPSYMAPEQAKGKTREIGAATDVYALGAVLYEMLTGRPPFEGDSAFDILRKVEKHEPVPPRKIVYGLSLDLDTICIKCLQKDPAKRYLSAEVLADELQRFLRGDLIDARPIGWFERFMRWCTREPRLAITTTLLLSVFVITAKSEWEKSKLRSEVDRLAKLAESGRVQSDRAVDDRQPQDAAKNDEQQRLEIDIPSQAAEMEPNLAAQNDEAKKSLEVTSDGETKAVSKVDKIDAERPIIPPQMPAEPLTVTQAPASEAATALVYVTAAGDLRIHHFPEAKVESVKLNLKQRPRLIIWSEHDQRLVHVEEYALMEFAFDRPREQNSLGDRSK